MVATLMGLIPGSIAMRGGDPSFPKRNVLRRLCVNSILLLRKALLSRITFRLCLSSSESAHSVISFNLLLEVRHDDKMIT